MAEKFDDMEFWLPEQFLSEDDDVVFHSNGSNYNRCRGFMSREGSFGSVKFGFGDSDLNSPVDSVVSSTDEEYFGSLTRQMKNSCIDESKAFATADFYRISGCMNGRSCGPGSSHGSPTGPLKAAASPETWNLLCEAAGEVEKISQDGAPARKPTPVSAPLNNSYPKFDYQFNHPVHQQRLQALRFRQMELVMMMKQQKQALWEEQVKASLIQRQQQLIAAQQMNNKMNLSPAATWPQMRPQHNRKSGMGAMLHGHPQAAKKERAGTGVFLPRSGNYASDSRMKANTCPPVLIPDRVVQALNLNSSVQPPPQLPRVQPHYGCGLNSETDTAMRIRDINNLLLQAQNNRQQHNRPQPAVNHEIRLPQDWTYETPNNRNTLF